MKRMADVCTQLDGPNYVQLWSERGVMTVEQVIIYAPEDEPLSIVAVVDRLHFDSLTKRELEILCLIADGLNSPEIAHRLTLSVETVRWYRRQIYSKLDIHTRAQAIARARELRLLP